MTKTITVPNPRSLEIEKDLVIIPRKEYEALVRIKFKGIPEVRLTSRQKRAIFQSEQELQRGDYFTLNEFDRYLARSRSKTRR
jgi:hypothetical protein